jgi:hypothetical protein
VKIAAASGVLVSYSRALLDTGSHDTLFPLDAAMLAGAALLPRTPHIVRWRGLACPLRFGYANLQLEAAGSVLRWNTMVGFTSGMPHYPILGIVGFLEYFDALFHGADRIIELTPNNLFPGSIDADDG